MSLFTCKARAFALLLCLIAVGMFGLFAQAAPAASSSTPVIGVVDRGALETGFSGYAKASQRLNVVRTASEESIRALVKGIGLPPAEFKEYQQSTKANIVKDDKRIKELTDLAQKNMDELKTLYNKVKAKEELTKEQQARYDQLMKYYEEGSGVASEMDKDATGKMKDMEDRFHKVLDEAENAAIAEVAKSKKLTIVLPKEIRANDDNVLKFVLWGGTDITSDIVKSLNETFKESALDAKPAEKPNK